MRGYFDAFAFQSITTAEFAAYLGQHLLSDPVGSVDVEPNEIAEWIYRPGLPATMPQPQSDAFARVEGQAVDVDGVTWLLCEGAEDVLPGEFAQVEIVDAGEHDLTARVVA